MLELLSAARGVSTGAGTALLLWPLLLSLWPGDASAAARRGSLQGCGTRACLHSLTDNDQIDTVRRWIGGWKQKGQFGACDPE